MASYKGHVTGATFVFGVYLSGLAVLYSVGDAYAQFSAVEVVVFALALYGICVLFALWPDVDTNSKAQTLFYSIFLVVDAVLILARYYEPAAYFGLLAILPVLSRHRGWTHTWWAALAIPLPLLLLPILVYADRPLAGVPFYGAAVFGYTSHLVLDLLPLQKRRA